MKFIIFILFFLLQNVSLSFSIQNKTNIINENKEKGCSIIKGYNYNLNETGYAAKIEKEPVFCMTNLIPGINWMERGIDLNTLDFFPFGRQSIKRANGFAESVFHFTCNNNQKWKPKSYNQTYNFPDQIQSLREISAKKLDSVVFSKKSLSRTKEELAEQAGLEFDYNGFGFTSSETYKQVKKSFTEKKTFVVFTQLIESIYEIELSDEIIFSSKFLMALNNLPAKYENGPKEYQNLFDDFGTHYFAIAQFGGSIVLKTKIEKNLLNQMSEQSIQEKLKTKFKEFAKLNMFVEKKEEKLNEEFNKQCSNQLFYFGGYADLVDKQAFKEWEKTVLLRPWLISGKLKPIYEVISDSNKAEQIKIAMNVALARSEIIDIQQSLTVFKKKKEILAIPQNVQNEWTIVKKFFNKSQKKFSFNEVETNMQKLSNYMRLINKAF